MTVKSSISLTDAQDAFVRHLVKEGRYSSASAVLQQGLELLRRESEETEALHELLEQRRKGPFINFEDFREDTQRMIAEKNREHGLAD